MTLRLRVRNSQTGEDRVVEVPALPVSLGRASDNIVVLKDIEVSRHHAALTGADGRLFVSDLGSDNRTALNGRELETGQPTECLPGDCIGIGPFFIELVSDAAPRVAAAAGRAGQPSGPRLESGLYSFKRELQSRFMAQVAKRKTAWEGLKGEEETHAKVKETLAELLGDEDTAMPVGWSREALLQELLNDFVGLGPLAEFIDDDAVTEIMVNGAERIYIERGGKLTLTGKRFLDDNHVQLIIQRIIQPRGRRIDESVPYVDSSLKDGSRVHAIIPPLAIKGSTLTIRKFSKKKLAVDDLVGYGSLSPQMAEFLETMVKYRANILVSGGTGSGKTTLLNVLSNFIPDGERIITVEDTAELRLNKQHVVCLEARPPNPEGKGEVTIRDLVRNTLRMRPDRIVVGECRGGEALDMLQAMNTGHDGSLTTIHANTPRDTLARLETLVLMARMDLPSKAIREQIQSAINFVVQTSRLADGSRKVTYITEITGLEANAMFTTQDIFTYRQTGFGEDGKVTGKFVPTGNVPRFVEDLRARGIAVNMEAFRAA